ncbi:hypothetical protein Aph01nite_41390 [Acrocarpospora phusangensis]|uniref:Uncharacterized protein n=1 Tax=Acrocarpospora phusangensis TaxID=1070424 RepID=A0A919QAZ8_9ACTN|nr:hypothetical protein Aph01nite_41390 [Acrocarpospora phusangensis]
MKDQQEVEQVKMIFRDLSPNAKSVIKWAIDAERENLHLTTPESSKVVVDQLVRKVEGIG